MNNESVQMVKSTVLDSLQVMDIPEGILKSCQNDRENFDNVMARKLCLRPNENTFEGFNRAVDEYLEG